MLYKRVFIILIFFGLVKPAFAQTPPPGESPEAMGSRYQAQMEREKKLSAKKAKPPETEVEKAAQKLAPEGPSFVLKDINITGITIFKSDDLKPLYESYLNKEVKLKDLEAIARKIESVYDEKGYLTTNVYLPEQQIKDGMVEIKVVEGKSGDVKVEGGKWFSADLLKKYFHLKKNEVLNVFKLQKDALRVNQNPDVQAVVVLEAAKDSPGVSDIIIKETDKFPHHAGVNVDNQGSRLTGRYRTSFSFRSSNLSAHNDSLFVNALVSSGAQGEFVSYTLPVDTYDTKIGFDFSYFTTKLGREFSSYDITGNSFLYKPYITQEICLSDAFQMDTDYGIEMKSIKKYSLGNKTTVDELRMPYISFNLSNNDSFFGGGQNSFSPKFTFSTTTFLGASFRGHPEASRQGTGGFFFEYGHSISRIQVMPFESLLSMRSQFQLASRTLPSSEQFQLGGANSIRGYPEGDYLSDSGANLNIDWIFPSYFIPKEIKLPYADRPLRNQLQPIAFLDLGGGVINKVMPGERKEKFLMGAGGGLQFNFNRNLSLRAEWAQAIGDRPTQGTGPSTFHLSFRFET